MYIIESGLLEWDEDKADRNSARHGVRFTDAVGAFAGPHALEFVDEDHSTGTETRYATIGLAAPGLVYVVFTERSGGRVRIIHARHAENWMVKEYEKQSRGV
jgi:uncharacterized DUF497 family protein